MQGNLHILTCWHAVAFIQHSQLECEHVSGDDSHREPRGDYGHQAGPCFLTAPVFTNSTLDLQVTCNCTAGNLAAALILDAIGGYLSGVAVPDRLLQPRRGTATP
ncbi:hypothetical protein [Marinobacter sp. ANT_B65]|uniref:hypothetical protein n=1 Tax=Marinobacter sp. ANT_B65 TaxID=2039467 RepID=UPI000BBE7C78|nr:hypothetical protein [Marinobacter sp. ANT_B65]PCM45394.1 hypothetical protein CPA50_05145 [Marinobacter sp. ANT_B65]